MMQETFQIRLESIGGLGANLCGKLLGELAVEVLCLNASGFSSYGSEKTGSPVSSYIRWSPVGRQIREVSAVLYPDIIGIFHEAMIDEKNVFSGAAAQTRIVINSKETAQKLRKKCPCGVKRLYAVDCQQIAKETHSRVNMAMLGALVKAIEVLSPQDVCDFLKKKFARYGEEAAEGNCRAFLAGYETGVCDILENTGEMQIDKDLLVKSKWGYKNAPKGGINPVMGSTVTNDLSAVRCGEVPLYLPEKCIHCGLCDTTCPDMVFRFEPGEYNKKRQMVNCGLDYHHCKGCLRCVDVCPTHALVKADERSARLRFFVRNKDLIAEELDYEKKGANSWVTTESQQNDGGLEGGTYER